MFGIIVSIFDIILYWPLFNFLILIYNYLPGHDFGLAIIVLTIVIKIALYPLAQKATNSQLTVQKLKPQIDEIQRKYKDDKEKQGIETLELYRREKINPFSTLFLVLVQIPIIIALYRVSLNALKVEELANLYAFIVNPGVINPFFLNVINLSHPSVWFAVIASLLQFFQTKMLMPKTTSKDKDDISAMVQKQMTYISPFITVIILVKLPAAVGLYWIVSGIFSIIQQYFILRHKENV